MSSEREKKIENAEFIGRFIALCGSDEPAKIQRSLKMPYQTVLNYLRGRLPSPEMLIYIAKRTSCSIDWLLTGRGKKFIFNDEFQDTPLVTGQMETFVRNICVEVINEIQDGKADQPKTVVLHSSDILSEKVEEKDPSFAGRQR